MWRLASKWRVLLMVLAFLPQARSATSSVQGVSAIITIAAYVEDKLLDQRRTEGEEVAVRIISCSLDRSSVHVGEWVKVSAELEIRWGAIPRDSEGIVSLNINGEPGKNHRFFGGEASLEHRLFVFDVAAIHTGVEHLQCEVNVQGYVGSSWFLPRYPRLGRARSPMVAVHAHEPYRLTVSDPDPPRVFHGSVASADLVIEVMSQSPGRVDRERTRMNGVTSQVVSLPGNSAGGQTKRYTLIRGVRASHAGCKASRLGSPVTLKFGVDDFRVEMEIDGRDGHKSWLYVFESTNPADLPAAKYADSYPAAPSCRSHEDFSEPMCACVQLSDREKVADADDRRQDGVSDTVQGRDTEDGAATIEPGTPAGGSADGARLDRGALPPESSEGARVQDQQEGPFAIALPRAGEDLHGEAPTRVLVGPRFLVKGGVFQLTGPDFHCGEGLWLLLNGLPGTVEACTKSWLHGAVPMELAVGEHVSIGVRDESVLQMTEELATVIELRTLYLRGDGSGPQATIRFLIQGTEEALWLGVSDVHGSCLPFRGSPVQARSSGGRSNDVVLPCRRFGSAPPTFRVQILSRRESAE